MARTPVLLDTSSSKFAFLSTQVEAASLDSAGRNSADQAQVRPIPSWIENLWPMPDNRLSAIVKNNIGLPAIPSDDMDTYINRGINVSVVNVDTVSSYLLTNESQWQVLSQGAWYDLHTPSAAGAVSVYVLKGVTYMFEPTSNLYQFDPANNPSEEFEGLAAIVLTGINPALMISSCAAVNYRIFVDQDTIYWSAPENENYFTAGGAGVNFGAGSARAVGITTPIQFVTGAEDGFYVYTTTNIVKASYSGNPNNPWRFKVVEGSTGVLSQEHVFRQNILTNTFCWSATGFAALSPSKQVQVAPDLTELLAGDVYEEYEPTTRSVETKSIGNAFSLQLVFAGKRTICISYGIDGQLRKYIIIYDTVTKKWGRLKIDHVAILDVIKINTGGKIFDDWVELFEDTTESFASFIDTDVNPQYRTVSIGILGTDGVIHRLTPIDIFTGVDGVDSDMYEVLPNVLVYPKLRLSRRSIYDINEVILNNGFASYSDDGNSNRAVISNNTAVYGYSELDSTIYPFSIRPPLGGDSSITEFVQTITGNDITLALEGINSNIGIEVIFKKNGRSW